MHKHKEIMNIYIQSIAKVYSIEVRRDPSLNKNAFVSISYNDHFGWENWSKHIFIQIWIKKARFLHITINMIYMYIGIVISYWKMVIIL